MLTSSEVGEGNPQPADSVARLFLFSGRRTLVLALLLVAAVVAAYFPVAHNQFVNLDDGEYITDNPHVRAGLRAETIRWAFTTFDAANYHPLTWLSHALDCQLFGVDPAAHHEMNVLLHAANALLLFLFLLSATGAAWRSWLVAALFALHPLQVESVAWAAERKNVLSLFFLLVALLAYVAYARRPSWQRYLLVALAFALGLLAKPQIITLPFLLLLLDVWPLRRAGEPVDDAASALPPRSPQWLVLEKLPLLALALASAVVTLLGQRAGGAVQTLTVYSPALRLESSLIGYVRYFGKALWPSDLAVYYPHATQLYPAWQVLVAALLLAAISAAVLRARSRRYLAVGWFWFLGALVPMIGLVQVGRQAIADRYAYLPLIGLFVAIVWLGAEVVGAVRSSSRSSLLRGVAVACAAILLALGALTFRQVGYWRNSEALWTHTLAVTEGNYIAHDTLARYLAAEGRMAPAEAHFRASLQIAPDDLPARLGLAVCQHARGDWKNAIANYQTVIERSADPGQRAEALGNLGSAYRQLGDPASARDAYRAALALKPDLTMAMVGLGLIAQRNGDPAEAVRQYAQAMSLRPTFVGFLLMAQAMEQQGRHAEAREIRELVARRCPDPAGAQAEADGLLAGK